jgi:hypothetical protein
MRPCLSAALRAAITVVSALALASCGGANQAGPAGPAKPAPPGASSPGSRATASAPALSGQYVALGDSFSAAPGVPALTIAAGCLRSDHNYPHLVAADLSGVRLRDVTCSAATTASLIQPQQTVAGLTVPPQLDAVTSATRYVTLSIGGNDFGLYSTLTTCLTQGGCAAAVDNVDGGVDQAIETIGQRLTRALDLIHHQAPQAKVALVGYPQVVPASGGCPRLRLSATDAAVVHGVFVRMTDRMARAAHDGNAAFVDVLTPSHGHDICSADPWVNGPVANERAYSYPPYGAEQRAVATLVEQAFGRLSAR